MVLIVKVKRGGIWDEATTLHDLRFIKEHLTSGWPDSIVVQEVNEGEIISDLVRGKSSLDVLAGLLE